MCSWCWGLVLIAEALSQQTAADGVAFHLVAGGLHASHGAALDPNTHDYILGHWQTAQQTAGQPFRFDGALPEGFIHDTEPACRALVVARSLDEESAWPLARAIQRMFYTEGRDITQAMVLANPAGAAGIPRIEFAAVFDSGEVRDTTAADFTWVQDLGIAGFLTLLIERSGQLALLTNDYQPLTEPSPLLSRWLEWGRHE